mgnify:FL=1
MGFRTVIVNSRCKLEFRLNYLIVRGETEKRIYVNEINTLIVQSTAVSLTAALMCELSKNNVKVIFCDEKCNPQTELVPYYGAHNTSKRYKMQLTWKEEVKGEVWKVIVKRKIQNQAKVLFSNGFLKESQMLDEYAAAVVSGDKTNREGHAAKVYFNCMLPGGISRRSGGFVNGCLDYGYAIILSAINREIAASGYLTQLGIMHDNEFNQFNLSCDLIEPLRTVADETAFSLESQDKDFKKKMANVLNYNCVFDGKNTTLDVAIRLYVKSVLFAMDEEKPDEIIFPCDIAVQYE